MGLILPNPNYPANGDTLDATQLYQNQQAITEAIQSFDGSQINAGTVQATALATNADPQQLLGDGWDNFVSSGCTWSGSSASLVGSMSSGIIYQKSSVGLMIRVPIAAIGSYTFTASQDTYIDLDYDGNPYYLPVANNAAAPALTANAQRIAKIVTNGTGITSIVQLGTDSLGNFIYRTSGNKTKFQYTTNPYKFSVYWAAGAAGYLATSGATYIMKFDNKLFDTGNNFSLSTWLFTAPIAGFYWFGGSIMINNGSSVTPVYGQIQVNGTIVKQNEFQADGQAYSGTNVPVSGMMKLNAGDTVGLYAACGTPNIGITAGGPSTTWFEGFLVSAL